MGAYPYWAYVFDYMAEHEEASQDEAETEARKYFEGKGVTDFTYTQWFDFTGGYLTDDAGEIVQDTIGDRAGQNVYAYDCWWATTPCRLSFPRTDRSIRLRDGRMRSSTERKAWRSTGLRRVLTAGDSTLPTRYPMRPGRSSGTSAETGEATATVNGDVVTMTNDELNVDSATAKVPLNVVNSKGFDLPQTGAAGTAIFAIAGIVIVAVAGIGILSYPFVSNMLHDRKQDEIITEYDEQMAHLGDEEKEQMLEAAREYNEDLIGNVVLSDPFDPAALERINENYDDLLNYEGNGIMGYVEIPRIDVYEAVYHGTSDEVLSRICIIWQINWKTARCTGNLKKMPGRHPKRMAEPVCQLKTRLIQMEKNLRGCMNR